AGYDVNPTMNNHTIEKIANQFLEIDIEQYISKYEVIPEKNTQINLFQAEETDDNEKYIQAFHTYLISKLYTITIQKLAEMNSEDLFHHIEMPLITVLGDMQVNGMHVDKEELVEIGRELKEQLENLKQEIYQLC